MKRVSLIFILFFAFLPKAYAATHASVVDRLHSPDTRPCTFFTLAGVTIADASVSTVTPYFAVPLSRSGYDTIFSMLLTSYSTKNVLHTVTTGSAPIECGGDIPGISVIQLQ